MAIYSLQMHLLILLLSLISSVVLISIKDWENEVVENKIQPTNDPEKSKSSTTDLLVNGDKGNNEIRSEEDYKDSKDIAVHNKKGKQARDRLRSAHLLGPLHGPEWILDNADIPHLRPITGSNSAEGTFLWAVGLFGTVENGAVVITVLSSRQCRRPLHILVGCLGITDLFVTAIYIPSFTYFLLEGVPNIPQKKENISLDTYKTELNFCVIARSFFIEIASVTLTIKTLIAGYLYIYTLSKQTAEKLFTFRNTVALILCAWLLNFVVLFVPILIGYGQVDFYPNSMLCQDNWPNLPNPLHTLELPAFIYQLVTLSIHMFELIILCLCFIRVHYAIREGQSIWEKKSQDQVQDRPNAAIYNRAMKTTILLFVSFALCWVPIYAANMVDPLHTKLPPYIHHLVMDLMLLKSAINPAIYIYGVRSLRRELKIMCMCRCRDPNARNIKFKAPNTSSFESGKTGVSGNVKTSSA